MQAKEFREKYLRFFEAKGHKRIPSASLIPENDPTVLFTTAGMQSLVPFLLGQKHPLGNRVCNAQKCIRTGDIDDVGDATHLTFFEMLGNWSFGDYFKREAIGWSFEFLTKELNIPLEKLAFTVFEGLPRRSSGGAKAGEMEIPKDEEAAEIWQSLGVPKGRITYLSREENFWGPAGQTGPCGPCTEMFYWVGPPAGGEVPEVFDPNDKRWVEIWNDVFMQYNKVADGRFAPLAQKNVDTGMGLERIIAILQGRDNVYQTELFRPLLEKVSEISGQPYQGNEKPFRIIADHLKASAFILAEELIPANVGRGYVLRRLIRRAVRYGRQIGIMGDFTGRIAKTIIEIYCEIYPELVSNQKFILEELNSEEEKFTSTLGRGLKEFEKLANKPISGRDAFNLYQTYGFPIEMTKELGCEKGISVDEEAFQSELKKHQELSRTASTGQFKSGLADDSEQTTKYHTATHLMLAALRRVLGDQVEQKGSNITPERIRFDFNLDRKMLPEEIGQVEDIVNQKIQENLAVIGEEVEIEKAREQNAVGSFGHKYGERVKVYSIGFFSKEICSGPHVQKTGELGKFKIIKEEASSRGVRRIKAILE